MKGRGKEVCLTFKFNDINMGERWTLILTKFHEARKTTRCNLCDKNGLHCR